MTKCWELQNPMVYIYIYIYIYIYSWLSMSIRIYNYINPISPRKLLLISTMLIKKLEFHVIIYIYISIYIWLTIINPWVSSMFQQIPQPKSPDILSGSRGRGAGGFVVHRQTLICRGGAAEQLAVHVEVLGPVLNVFRPILNMMGCFIGFCWGYGDVTKRRGYNND